MGRLYYGNSTEAIAVDDRELAHLKMVATAKLRRSEGFAVSFSSARHGRSTVWVHCAIPLRFDFDDAEPIRLDPAHVNELAQAAASTMGIVIDLDAAARAERPELAVVA
ncbi:MAG: RNA polymerase subunit sigma [Microbacterium sp.]|uniref:DUF7882 family protein n=1 Tax=Microbacterium sp. TaxID=51671 RepID=UPI001AD3CFF2|nr:RNA polymerase subunit sigma [Microbacterium sp.]MBN9176545.1 RNA polymerase subunit sigma [Microbacterium sp.]